MEERGIFVTFDDDSKHVKIVNVKAFEMVDTIATLLAEVAMNKADHEGIDFELAYIELIGMMVNDDTIKSVKENAYATKAQVSEVLN